MESKKIQWNKLFNNLIASVSLILASLLIGICFISPVSSVYTKALTKTDIVDTYNIYFNSAKTRIRTATGYNKTSMLGNKVIDDNYNLSNLYSFNSHTYQYDNNTLPDLYSSSKNHSTLENYSGHSPADTVENQIAYGNVQLITSTEKNIDGQTQTIVENQTIYEKYNRKDDSDNKNWFIPNGVTHFKNGDNYEEVFYEEIDDNDFVLLNNYTNHINSDKFNVENLYLSFGTPFINELIDSTPLHSLSVTATLINTDNQKYSISLNEVGTTDIQSFIDKSKEDSQTLSHYWYQYFDLKNIKGMASEGATYDIENTQGRYEFTFEFIRYVKNNEGKWTTPGVAQESEIFNYTFYLLDCAEYDTIPTVNNATLGSVEKDQPNEYFYNFNSEEPYVKYNPANFNLSYKRENREIIENITSTYTTGTYTFKNSDQEDKDIGQSFPKNVITYNKTTNENSSQVEEKQVFILTYYNKDELDQNAMTFVEYLYLSDVGNKFNDYNFTYEQIISALNSDQLKFEYKIAKVLNITTNGDIKTYETITYKTTNYYDYPLNKETDLSIYTDTTNHSYVVIDTNYIFESTDGTYKYSETDNDVNNAQDIAKIKRTVAPITFNAGTNDWTTLTDTGLIINSQTLTITNTFDNTTSKYKLLLPDTKDQKNKIVKTYYNGNEEQTAEILLYKNSQGIHEVFDTTNTEISIIYEVNNETNITSVTIVKNTYTTSNLQTNTRILNRLNNLNSVPMEMSYELYFDDLGIYTFNYDYSITAGEQPKEGGPTVRKTFNNSTTSTNKLNIKDYALTFGTTESQENTVTSDLKIKVWGYLNTSNEITLNGTTYKYNKSESKLNIDGINKSYNLQNNFLELDEPEHKTLGNFYVPTTYEISTATNGDYVLTITYTIGTVTTEKTKTEHIAKLSDQTYVNNYEILTKQTFTLAMDTQGNEISSALLTTDPNNANDPETIAWANISSLLELLEERKIDSNREFFTESVDHNSDILHVFGSITYFNKKLSSTDTDSGYEKLEQVDSKLKKNYISDVTTLGMNYIKQNVKKSNYEEVFDGNKISSTDFSDINVDDFKHFSKAIIGSAIDPENLIVTDMTPTFWKNFSTLLYNGKISQSYIFRYPNYTIKEDGTIDYGSECIKSTYTKDTYVQFDGLYEIVVFYKYDYYKNFNDPEAYDKNIFYQLFTFAIDNSSPTLDIKVEDDNHSDEIGHECNYNQSLGLNKFTNRNMELSWKIPTYFQNDIYLDIDKQTFNNDSDSFKAEYTGGRMFSNSAGAKIVTSIITDEQNRMYRVYIESNPDNTYATPNGKYKVTLHYSSRGESTVTDEFVIDKMPIDGKKIQPVVQNANGTYSVDTLSSSYNTSKQIVNYDFTFRYNPKNSGAQIFTYWYKIDLKNATVEEYDKLLNLNKLTSDGYSGDYVNQTAITTTFKVDGTATDDFALGNRYIYDYNTDNTVNNANYFSSNNSCIYLFKMVDEAGNEARYVVFYDTTNPRYLIEPEITNENNIINDSTKITFGNYKAILIATKDDNYVIPLAENLDDYNFKYDKEKITDNLQESLIYINSMANSSDNTTKNKFNETKIISHDGKYYLLLPIDSVTVQDESSTTLKNGQNYLNYPNNSSSEIPDEYFFFPSNPVNGNQIELPVIEKDQGNNIIGYSKAPFDISSYSTTALVNINLQKFNRFIVAYNNPDIPNPYGKNVYGAFGEGEFTYQVYDRQRNKTSGYVWMNLDKTQTILYGLYNKNIEDASKAFSLGDAQGGITSAASSIYISSLVDQNSDSLTINNTNVDYTVTYDFYKFNPNYFTNIENNYVIKSINIVNSTIDNVIKVEGLQQYLEINYIKKEDVNKANASIAETIYIEMVDKYGNSSPQHNYPYEWEGTPLVTDNENNAEHIYLNNRNSHYINYDKDGTRRIFSTIINPTADPNGNGNIVTQEGLYIFKREYSANIGEEQLGEDSMLRYQVIYVDRNGIINIAMPAEDAETLGFILGRDYPDANKELKAEITAKQIENQQVINTSNASASNTYTTAKDLFNTNKTQVQFNLTADKYNFQNFYNTFYGDMVAGISQTNSNNINTIQNYYKSQLFNSVYYTYNLYKVNLTLNKYTQSIINESETDLTKQFNTNAISLLLKDHVKNTVNVDLNNNNVIDGDEKFTYRSNEYNFYLEDAESNPYNIYLKDNGGYRLFKGNTNEIEDANYLANQLDTSFKIKHTAPSGDTYGKDYSLNYDENKSSTGPSIPMDQNKENYLLLEKYLKERKLVSLSLDTKSSPVNSVNGQQVQLYSTNNETLIFTFAIPDDKYQAKIDENNITISMKSPNDSQPVVIFNRKDGNFDSERMLSSYIENTIDGIKYCAIIVFDNNLDEILDPSESSYGNFRLLDSSDNLDKATYYLTINYVGFKENYIKEDMYGNKNSYASTTYEITIDRIKPMYNLTKLMSLDKYVYNPAITTVTKDNYEKVFEKYKSYYQFETDEAHKFDRSYLENYFFALDYREKSQFVFESISEFDSNNGIYIRHVDKNNYKFSLTPDDYKAYNTANYLEGHPLFSPSRATSVNSYTISNPNELNSLRTEISADTSKYFYLPYSLFEKDTSIKEIKASDLVNTLLDVNECYEIIECDEAGNYRVYAVYIPYIPKTTDSEENKRVISFEYQPNQSQPIVNSSLDYYSTYKDTISGIEFELTNYNIKDYFIKAYVEIISTKLNEKLTIYYEPNDKCIYIKNSKILNRDIITNVSIDDYKTKFIEVINEIIEDYNNQISNESSAYYTKYGHTIKMTFVDRLGIATNVSNKELYDYQLTYNVAGSILAPVFKNGSNSFEMYIPGKTGTTNIVDIDAYIYRSGWALKDPDDKLNSFNKSAEELMNGFTYTLGKGVYKFVITDNFGRANTYFHEFGTSGSQVGGNLKFTNANVKYSDGYTYTSNKVNYTYDSSIYEVYVRFIGSIEGNMTYKETDTPHIIYQNNKTYTEADLSPYGITISTTNNITTITFAGVSTVSPLSKYHIKVLPAGISAKYEYTWGKEENDTNILVYDKKIAFYTALPTPIIKNLTGNILDSSKHLNLTEDFEVTISWSGIDVETQIDFNSKIVLERTYTENNIVKPEILSNSNKYLITKPGDYVAYVTNDLNTIKNNAKDRITFTRGEGQISMYAVYTIDKDNKLDTQLIPSSKVDNEKYIEKDKPERNVIVFNYFTTMDYFNFTDLNGTKQYTVDDLNSNVNDNFKINENAKKYLDIRVNSNLSIFVDACKLSIYNETPYVEFKIYSKNNSEEIYIYRFIKIFFLDNSNYELATTTVNTILNSDNIYKGTNPIIKRPDNTIIVQFNLEDEKHIDGNTIYVDRYYNSELVETITYTSIDASTRAIFELTQVGLHSFVIRDLANRKQIFGSIQTSNATHSLQIYLINQILFTVNNESPINNQIFNGEVNLKILATLNGIKLYNTDTLGITVTRNGVDLSSPNSTDLTFTEQGYYTVKIVATTVLSDATNNIADQEISTTYNFVILRTDVALRNFNVSNGTGFVIDKLIKIVNNEKTDITMKYECEDSLLWLSHEEQGNSMFEVTLKYFDTNLKVYRPFTFNVWINEDTPVIISSIPNGTSTKNVITLDFNPGMIYSQIGRCKILVNDSLYMQIDDTSERVSNTITIEKKGTYFVQIVSDDGSIISSYKFTKSDPINKTTQTVIICIAIGIVVLVAVFFLVRRKGKYR